MAISVIISNFNGARFLPRLLATLQQQEGVEVEIIVVDRNSTDGSAEILRDHPGVKVVSEPPLSGLVSGYHRGVREATHEHLFFCNEDMWFDPQCLARLERHIDLPTKIAAADPWQWSFDEVTWIHGGTRFEPARWNVNCVYPFRGINYMVALPEGALIPFPCAGAFLIHRQVYEEAGGWDTSIFMDNEDIDLFTRVWQRGWKCVSVPGAKVYHAVGMGSVQADGKPRTTVVKRRYVSSRMGQPMIVSKYFSPSLQWIGWMGILLVTANNLLKLRWKMAPLDLQICSDFLKRRGDFQAYRQAHAKLNRQVPGEGFFTQPDFQAESDSIRM